MADKLAKIRDFLFEEASKRRNFRIGPSKRPNGKALAKAFGVNPSTVTRILNLDRGTLDAENRIRPVPEYQPSAELVAGMMRVFGYDSEGDLWTAIWGSKEAPPPENDVTA